MREHIQQKLRELEQEQACKILYACESGSRAWGFASPDSDYDVRFIYVKPLPWYLSIKDQSDTIQAMLPNDLDLSGWELRKTLRLFATSNMALFEWLNSPMVYYQNTAFHTAMCEQIGRFFNPKKAMYNYLSIAKSALQNLDQTGHIGIKKLFYVFRPLVACWWIQQHQTVPPTDFHQMLADVEVRKLLPLAEIQDLYQQKLEAPEGMKIRLEESINRWIVGSQNSLTQFAESMKPNKKADTQDLEQLMLHYAQPI